MRPALALACILVLVAPGCVSLGDAPPVAPASSTARLPNATLPVLPGESVFYESFDGTTLHLRLFLPDTAPDPEWKSPTILVMSPYFGHDSRMDPLDPASMPDYERYQWLVKNFVPRGYAVAFADVRGTGDSGGCLEQTAEAQSRDGYVTVEWLAAQPWSNGRVGMYGKSYDGETQQSTAVLAPPHLTTIVPLSSVAGQYDYGYYDGVPYPLWTFGSNVFYMTGDGLQPPTTAEGLAAYPQRPGCHPEMLLQGTDTSGDWSGFWEVREIRRHAGNVTASVFYVFGFEDWNVKPVNIRDWLEKLPGPKTAWLGQWEHDYPEENRFRSDWSRKDWREAVQDWFDHWLLGLDTPAKEQVGVIQVQDSLGRWRREATWPPVDSKEVRLYLSGDRLVAAPDASGADLEFREPSGDFAASILRSDAIGIGIGGAGGPLGPPEGLRFESDPLAAEVLVAGWPTLTLNVTLDKADAHFAAHLIDVAPGGTETVVNRAYLSAVHRDGVEHPSPVPVGEQVTYHLRFFPQDDVIPAGHRVALWIGASDDWTLASGSGFTAKLSVSSDAPSFLSIPAIERDFAEVGLDVEMGEPE